MIKLTRHWKVRDQIDTIEMLGTKLKYNVKNRDQICNLPSIFYFLEKLMDALKFESIGL